MKITYDKEADALYVQLKEDKIEESLEISDGIIVDLDKLKNPLGIEVLFVSRRFSPEDLAKISLENLAFATK
jgi:uncharacterized protein YuzE